jgi:ELWxxDGT repeat protein
MKTNIRLGKSRGFSSVIKKVIFHTEDNMHQPFSHSNRVWSLLGSGIIALLSIILMISFTRITTAGVARQMDAWPVVSLNESSEPFLVRDIYPGITSSIVSNAMFPTQLNDLFLFSADDGSVGAELWKTDGSLTGTVRIKDIYPGTGNSYPAFLYNYDGKIFFAAQDSPVYFTHLWKSDGTVTGTQGIPYYCTTPYSCYQDLMDPAKFIEYNGRLFFSGKGVYGFEALFATNGVLTGTQKIKDLAMTGHMLNLDNKLYFPASDNTGSQELWASDGTLTGTHILSDINPTGNAYVSGLTAFQGKIYFLATDGVLGQELWVSDGTSEGTQLVKDINPGSNGSGPTGFLVAGDALYFSAAQDATGAELWKTDGTVTGTVMVKDIYTGTLSSWAEPMIALNGKLLFVATDNLGREPWITDGTSEGTHLVKDINPGSASSAPGGFDPRSNVAQYINLVFFPADDGSQGNELWQSDGTPEGTMLVKDINSGAPGSDPSNLVVGNNMLLFAADDGVHGQELWAMRFPVYPKIYLPLVGR